MTFTKRKDSLGRALEPWDLLWPFAVKLDPTSTGICEERYLGCFNMRMSWENSCTRGGTAISIPGTWQSSCASLSVLPRSASAHTALVITTDLWTGLAPKPRPLWVHGLTFSSVFISVWNHFLQQQQLSRVIPRQRRTRPREPSLQNRQPPRAGDTEPFPGWASIPVVLGYSAELRELQKANAADWD